MAFVDGMTREQSESVIRQASVTADFVRQIWRHRDSDRARDDRLIEMARPSGLDGTTKDREFWRAVVRGHLTQASPTQSAA